MIHIQSGMKWYNERFHYIIQSGAQCKTYEFALAGVAQRIEHRPANQRVAGSIPSQGTCLGCRPGPPTPVWGA